MNIVDALNSKRRFRRKGSSIWRSKDELQHNVDLNSGQMLPQPHPQQNGYYQGQQLSMRLTTVLQLTLIDLLADDYELEEQSVKISRSRYMELWRKCTGLSDMMKEMGFDET